MIELDVRRTGDDELVVHHDDGIGDEPLGTLSYQAARELAETLGYTIPRFAELLDLATGRILLDVELKEAGYEEAALQLIFDGGLKVSDFVITSFLREAVDAVDSLDSKVRTGLLVDHADDMSGLRALELFTKSGADFLAPHYRLLDDRTLGEAVTSGTTLLPWTVNEHEGIERLLQAPAVFGVITDEPELGLQLRSGHSNC
jgi:glycerophosphoryl diester phosphodiesterase